MAKKRRSSQFKESSQVIDIEEARKKRQEKRQKQQQRAKQQETAARSRKPVRASVRAGRRRKSFVYIFVILCILIAIGFSVGHIVSLKMEYKEAEATNKLLTEEKEDLKNQLEKSDDDEFIEEEARQQLRMVEPGEKVYIVPFVQESAPETEGEE